MHRGLLTLAFMLALVSCQSPTGGLVSFDEIDESREAFEHAPDSLAIRLLRSSAALLFQPDALAVREPGLLGPSETARTHGEAQGLCEEAPHAGQPALAGCSAVLVARELVLTAGHCVEGRRSADLRVAFDYAYYEASPDDTPLRIAVDSVYEVVKIAERGTKRCTDDWALLRLARPVTDRPPLDFRRSGIPAPGTLLLAVGTPAGLPMKTFMGHLRGIDPRVLVTDLDTFDGHSGAPLFDAERGLLEGIHVCSEPRPTQHGATRRCSLAGCEGTTCRRSAQATRITRIAGVIDAMTASRERGPADIAP